MAPASQQRGGSAAEARFALAVVDVCAAPTAGHIPAAPKPQSTAAECSAQSAAAAACSRPSPWHQLIPGAPCYGIWLLTAP